MASEEWRMRAGAGVEGDIGSTASLPENERIAVLPFTYINIAPAGFSAGFTSKQPTSLRMKNMVFILPA
jgi:hypothetical protein